MQPPRAPAAHTPPSPSTGETVLVVEDDPTQTLLLRQLLTRAGYSVLTADTGNQALDLLPHHPVRLVISDIDMPGIDGFEMCRRIKTDPATLSIPVVLLTNLSSTDNLMSGLTARADSYLTKPYEPKFLLARVRQLIDHPSLHSDEAPTGPIHVEFDGRSCTVDISRTQLLSLLLGTYEGAVRQNEHLLCMRAELDERNREIQRQQEELQLANARLTTLATTDGLTGLNNHRSFMERLSEVYQQASPSTLVSLVLLDIDHFKSLNDAFGHQAGDEVLRALARILQQSARPDDFPARYGGEEFVVLLPNTDRSRSAVVAEKIRRAIEAAPWPKRSVTASLGVSTRSISGSTPEQLVAEADQALYLSKEAGRNRVTHAYMAQRLRQPQRPA